MGRSANALAQGKAAGLAARLPGDLGEAVTALRAHGDLSGGGYAMRPDTTLMQWATEVLPAAVIASEGSQFALADAILAGYRWADVQAVSLSTGEPADEDAAYGDDPDVIPFSYGQIADLVGRPAHTLQNLVSVARRFPLDLRAKFPAARFSHYAAIAARDLPPEKVEEWLSRAGRGGPEGLTVSALEHERDSWRRARDGAARSRAAALKTPAGPQAAPTAPPTAPPTAALQAVPKPSGPKGSTKATPAGPVQTTDGMLLADAQRACRNTLRQLLATGPEDVDVAAAGVVTWLYQTCPEEVILGALAYRLAVETGEPPF